jgi:WD40 repeat protein
MAFDSLAPESCPTCGAALSRDAGEAWCPRCALGGLLGSEAEPAERTDEAKGDASAGLFRVAGHVVLAELGRGAAGIVYRARQEQPDREVALKILRPHEAGSAESLARFRMEAATIAALDHPMILPVLTVGEYDGLPYFTMKLCRGSLAERVAEYRGRGREAAELVAELAGAVHHAHVRGVLHRDLKPGNVLFDEAKRPFIGDFGLAKLLDAPALGAVTRPLVVMGTPGYLAPEVLAGGVGQATTAVDVFALGAILHELLTGAPPPASGAAAARPGVPRDLAVICAQALAAEPGRRYASAEALAEDLRAWREGRPIAARPVSAFGRGAAWARRNPTLATTLAALFLAIAGGVIAVGVKNRALAVALAEARTAEGKAQASLAESLVAQAKAVRQSGREGQRRETLALLGRAAKIQPTDEMRRQATAALLLPDWGEVEKVAWWTGASTFAAPTPDLSACLVEDATRTFSLRLRAGGAPRWTWVGSAASASWPVFSADGRWVALHLRNDEVHVLAVADGRPGLQLTGRPYAFKGAVWAFGQDIDFSPDGALLAVARPEGGVSFHRPEGGEPVRVWAGAEWVTTMRFSPDGRRLAVGGGREMKDSLLAVIDVATARVLVQEKTPRRVEFTAWSDDGRRLAFRAAGGNAEVRWAANLKVQSVLPERMALHGKFLPDGERLLLTQQVSATRLWDIGSAQLLLAKDDYGRPGNWWSHEPLRQWRTYSDGRVHLTRIEDSPVLRTLRPESENATVSEHGWTAERSADGLYLAVAGWGGGHVWNLATGRMVLQVDRNVRSDAGALRFDADGPVLWASLVEKGLWRMPYRVGENGDWTTYGEEQIDPEPGYHLTASNRPSRRLALLNPQDGRVKILDTRTRQVVARWAHAGANSAEFSPDGARLIVNGTSVTKQAGSPATVYEVATGAVVRVLGSKAGRLARWSPGGKWVWASDADESAKLWDATTFAPGPVLPKDTQGQHSPLAFSADDRWLVLSGSDEFQIFDLVAGKTVLLLAPPGGDVYRRDLGLDGDRTLWTVTTDGRIHLWDLAVVRRELEAIGLGAGR